MAERRSEKLSLHLSQRGPDQMGQHDKWLACQRDDVTEPCQCFLRWRLHINNYLATYGGDQSVISKRFSQ